MRLLSPSASTLKTDRLIVERKAVAQFIRPVQWHNCDETFASLDHFDYWLVEICSEVFEYLRLLNVLNLVENRPSILRLCRSLNSKTSCRFGQDIIQKYGQSPQWQKALTICGNFCNLYIIFCNWYTYIQFKNKKITKINNP